MLTLPASVCGLNPNVTGLVEMLAATVLTTSYQYGESVLVAGLNLGCLELVYAKGSEVTVQIIAERSASPRGTADASATWAQFWAKAIQSGGVSEVTRDVLQVTPGGTLAASERLAIPPLDIACAERIRFGFKYTGGSAPGTVQAFFNAALLPVAAG